MEVGPHDATNSRHPIICADLETQQTLPLYTAVLSPHYSKGTQYGDESLHLSFPQFSHEASFRVPPSVFAALSSDFQVLRFSEKEEVRTVQALLKDGSPFYDH